MQLDLNRLFKIKGNILLTGETGTGKSHLAKLIHLNSINKEKKFITVNLATINESLIESELFGHKRGSFTGAFNDKMGKLDLLDGGTLFLDEIGELSLNSQKKLLGLIEEKLYYPVGGHVEKKFNGRIIAATNINLEESIDRGEFRKDLYYRLKVFHYHLPPLRKSTEKIVEFIETFNLKLKNQFIENNLNFSPEAINFMLQYQWPGNVRELKNCLEYIYELSQNETIQISDLPTWMLKNEIQTDLKFNKKLPELLIQESQVEFFKHFSFDYRKDFKCWEKIYLDKALENFQGKINITSRGLRISKTTLISKMREHGLTMFKYKSNPN
jgi:two-component system response regulator HydG